MAVAAKSCSLIMPESIDASLLVQLNEPIKVSFFARIINILKCVPKVFLGGFAWEGFALMSMHFNIEDHSPLFLLMTGLMHFTISTKYVISMPGVGDFIGVVSGQLLLLVFLFTLSSMSKASSSQDSVGRSNDMDIHHFAWSTVRVACSSFWSGFVWQANVNLAIQHHLTFTTAFLLVWCLSGLTFFGAYVVHGYVIRNYLLTDYKNNLSCINLLHDAEISLAVGCSAACFVGTSVRKEFEGNWLAILFGEPDEESFLLPAMLAAGASTVFGFSLCQMFICCILRKDSWTDHH